MNKILFTLLGVMLAFALVCSVSAQDIYAEAADSVTESETVSCENTEDVTYAEQPDGDSDGEFDFKAYLTEKVAPIAVGVLTSIVALMGTVAKVKSSILTLDTSSKGLKEVKESVGSTLKSVQTELERGIAEIKSAVAEIPEIKEGYRELAEGYEILTRQSRELMEAVKIGFQAMPHAVESGMARKIAIIAEKTNGEE